MATWRPELRDTSFEPVAGDLFHVDHPLSIRLKPRELGKVTLLHLYPRHTLLPMSALNKSLVPPSSVNTVISDDHWEVGQMIEDMKGKMKLNLKVNKYDENKEEGKKS